MRFFVLLCLLVSLATAALADAIEDAYSAIPHTRTVFDGSAARMSSAERDCLKTLFSLVDAAIVERVNMLIWLQSGGEKGAVATQYDYILDQLESLETPEKLKSIRDLVVSAIRQQKAFLEEWSAAEDDRPVNVGAHPLVQSASQKLHQAYAELMAIYPAEGSHNKQAFFDYLCALDFI